MFQCENTRYTGTGNLLITYLLACLLTPKSTVLFEKLTGFHLTKEIPRI